MDILIVNFNHYNDKLYRLNYLSKQIKSLTMENCSFSYKDYVTENIFKVMDRNIGIEKIRLINIHLLNPKSFFKYCVFDVSQYKLTSLIIEDWTCNTGEISDEILYLFDNTNNEKFSSMPIKELVLIGEDCLLIRCQMILSNSILLKEKINKINMKGSHWHKNMHIINMIKNSKELSYFELSDSIISDNIQIYSYNSKTTDNSSSKTSNQFAFQEMQDSEVKTLILYNNKYVAKNSINFIWMLFNSVNFNNLKVLNIGSTIENCNSNMKDNFIQLILFNCRHLKTFSTNNCTILTDDSLMNILQCQAIGGNPYSIEDFIVNYSLNNISMDGCKSLTPNGILNFAKTVKQLMIDHDELKFIRISFFNCMVFDILSDYLKEFLILKVWFKKNNCLFITSNTNIDYDVYIPIDVIPDNNQDIDTAIVQNPDVG